MRIRASLFALAGFACAELAPGTAPDPAQLHFPTSLAFAPGSSPAEDRLLVVNSNFDQRFNAGTVMALSVDALFAASGIGEALPVSSVVRIDSFGGELLLAPRASGASRVFVASRGRNRLSMLELAGGALSCANGSVTPIAGLDCTRGRVIATGGDDPFALAHLAAAGVDGLVAVGHLRPSFASAGGVTTVSGAITLVDLFTWDERLAREAGGRDLVSPAVLSSVGQLPGVSGFGLAPRHSDDAVPGLLVLGHRAQGGTTPPLAVLNVKNEGQRFVARERSRVSLGTVVRANATRNLAIDGAGARAYVALRFPDQLLSDGSCCAAFTSAIGVFDLTTSEPALVDLLKVGEELGQPVLRELGAGRLLYVPDIATDRVWIVDASLPRLRVIRAIDGRRVVDGVRRKLLDAPSAIVFASRGSKTLGFVANFATSTLAVIDASDADPEKHEIVARVGRALEPDGSAEGESP